MELSDLDAVTPGKHLFGCSSIFQHDNDPKHLPSAVKAHLERKTLSAIDWSPQSRVGSYWQRNPQKAAITQKLERPAEIFLLYKLCGFFALYTVVPYMFTCFNRFLNLLPIFLAKSKQIGSDLAQCCTALAPIHFTSFHVLAGKCNITYASGRKKHPGAFCSVYCMCQSLFWVIG